MKYLGIDYGSKRIGIAASDERGVFAFARKTIQNDKGAIKEVGKFIEKEGSEAIVIGIPKTSSGAENPVEEDIRKFSERLKEEYQLPVFMQDEQFSSIESSRFAPGEIKDDAASAAIILQRYLDANTKQK